jgi:hypothetical protein
MADIYIFEGVLQEISRSKGDVTGIPPGSSLIVPDIWKGMCDQDGGEASLIASIPAIDVRGEHALGQ